MLSLSKSLFPPILMMIRNSFASFSTSRLKMLPDNYSGSKLDTKKPSVKMSARHHHHLCRLYTTRSRRVLCVIINARTNKHTHTHQRERNWWENQTNRFPTEHLEIEFSFSLLSKYNSQQKETTQKREDVSDESTKGSNNTLSLFLPYFFMFLYTNTQFKDFCVVVCRKVF